MRQKFGLIPTVFRHWRWEVSEDALKKYGSPHVSRKDAGRKLHDALNAGATKVIEAQHRIPELAIVAGNEAYAESAVADPLSDLLVWRDWASGRRKFPYPGRYAPLEISRQDGKTESTAAIGVLGEILTGLYAQSGVAWSPVCRVIRRWPDFIFVRGGRAHFVEAKATLARNDDTPDRPSGSVSDALFQDCLLQAVQQFGADPWVQVWYAFVHVFVSDSQDLNFTVHFIELESPASRRQAIPRTIPPVLINELASRSLARAIGKMDGPTAPWTIRPGKRRTSQVGIAEARLQEEAKVELHHLIVEEADGMQDFASEIENEIEELVACLEVSGDRELANQEIVKYLPGRPVARLRDLGIASLITRPLRDEDVERVRFGWTGDWSQVEMTESDGYGNELYRAGGSLFGIVDRDHGSRFARPREMEYRGS